MSSLQDTVQDTVQDTEKRTYRDHIDRLVDNWIGYTIIRFAPLAAPLPAIATLLEASDYAFYIWLTVFGIEFTAYALGDQLVKGVRLGVLTLKQGAVGLGIYALAIEGLLLGYKVIPAWAGWDGTAATIAKPVQATGSILYPLFTIGGSILFAFHLYLKVVEERRNLADQKAEQRDDLSWEDDREFKLKQRDIELRKLAKASRESVVQVLNNTSTSGESLQNVATVPVPASIGKQIVRYLIDHPGALQDEIAGALDVSVSTISREMKALTTDGVLHTEKIGRRLVASVNGGHQAYLES